MKLPETSPTRILNRGTSTGSEIQVDELMNLCNSRSQFIEKVRMMQERNQAAQETQGSSPELSVQASLISQLNQLKEKEKSGIDYAGKLDNILNESRKQERNTLLLLLEQQKNKMVAKQNFYNQYNEIGTVLSPGSIKDNSLRLNGQSIDLNEQIQNVPSVANVPNLNSSFTINQSQAFASEIDAESDRIADLRRHLSTVKDPSKVVIRAKPRQQGMES